MNLVDPSYTTFTPVGAFYASMRGTLIAGSEIDEPRSAIGSLTGEAADLLLHAHSDDDGSLVLAGKSGEFTVDPFDLDAVAEFLDGLLRPITLDITSMDHRTWVPLMMALANCGDEVRMSYARPDDYLRDSEARILRDSWPLSKGFGEVGSLPGLLNTSDLEMPGARFVGLLGFEGARLERIMLSEGIRNDMLIPVIPSPGFRVEYPSYTALSNSRVLELSKVSDRIYFASASCPFDTYFVLQDLNKKFSATLLAIAPVGTKPHAVGAVLWAMRNPASTKVIYDYPTRSEHRTRGVTTYCVYHLGAFLRDYPIPC